MINNKLVSTGLLMSVGFMLSVQHAHAAKLSMDGSSSISLSENVNYNVDGGLIEINAADPIVCRKVAGSPASLNANIIDPNGDGVIMPLLQNVSYNIISQTVKAKVSNEDGVCATKFGSKFGDLIYRNQFSPAAFRHVGLNDQLVRGQSLDYKIRVENIDASTLEFDLIEYVSTNSVNNAAFFESVDFWNCNNHANNGVVCNIDNVANKLFNASVPGGGYAEIDVTRTVGSSAVVGQQVEVLTVLFAKNGLDEIVDVQVVSQSPIVVDNSAPVLTWSNITAVDFVEDDSQPHNLSFDVLDNTGVNLSPSYLATAIGGVNDKLDINNIQVVENQPGQYTVSFDVTPKPDQFTAPGNTEQIFVQIEDDFNASSNLLMLPVNIEPINDAPSFDLSCIEFTINPTPVGGETEISCDVSGSELAATWTYSDFINNISAGGVGNATESGQSVIFDVLPVSGLANNGSVIVTMDPGTFILNDLMLNLADGVSGEGVFRLRARDNGTPNGETDVCPAVSPTDHCGTSEYSQEITFTVLPPVYFVGGTIDDLPLNDELGVRLYEAGTNNALGGTMLIQGVGVNGGQTIKFTYPEDLLDGTAYDVQISLPAQNRNCSITNGDTGVINGMNVGDVFIDCDPL